MATDQAIGSLSAPAAINQDRGACDCDGGSIDEDGSALKSPSKRRRGYIPYSTIYESQDEIRKCGYWIPGIPVHASIVKVERDTTSNMHIINPFLYTISLEHGRYKWTVVRRYKDFSYLANRLLAHRALERMKAPVRRAKNLIEEALDKDDEEEEGQNTKSTRSKREKPGAETPLKKLSRSPEIEDYNEGKISNNIDTFDPTLDFGGDDDDDKREPSDFAKLPHFPMIPDAMVSEPHVEERRKRLEKWLQSVLNIPINREYHETAEFLEVSRYSFINELGGKYKEAKVKKRPGGNKVYLGCKQFCVRWMLPWGTRWLMVKDTYVCYMDPSNEEIRLVLFFDEEFEINGPELAAGIRPKELILSNLQHVLNVKCHREEDTQNWIDIIKAVIEDTGKVWLNKKPFGSSFPTRPNSYSQWFVDAKECWEKMAGMIEMAREEIFIADWWLCPEIFLRRPMAEGNHWRLDYALKRRAEKGVRIFILIYKEMEMALNLKSLWAKKYLQGLHPNIKVMRHPDHFIGGTFYWAHHEKLLIIDQLIAFVGGIDLCYGRWDNQQHVLTDLGSVQFKPRTESVVKVGQIILA